MLLTIGRRGTPRKLEVPGEEQSKVVYRLIDPEQYRGQHVVVVGGGDSALEAAASIAEEQGTTVTLSYRSEAFGRAKQKNRMRVDAAVKAGSLTVMLKTKIKAIGARTSTSSTTAKNLTSRTMPSSSAPGASCRRPFSRVAVSK